MKQTSKFLSYVLRHDPGSIGLTLDAADLLEPAVTVVR